LDDVFEPTTATSNNAGNLILGLEYIDVNEMVLTRTHSLSRTLARFTLTGLIKAGINIITNTGGNIP
jgi:hypothetical protein